MVVDGKTSILMISPLKHLTRISKRVGTFDDLEIKKNNIITKFTRITILFIFNVCGKKSARTTPIGCRIPVCFSGRTGTGFADVVDLFEKFL